MAYFIEHTRNPVAGCFQRKSTKSTKSQFEFRATDNEWALEQGFCYEVAVATQGFLNDQGYRFARILKTVAHILVDEDEVESWPIHVEWRM